MIKILVLILSCALVASETNILEFATSYLLSKVETPIRVKTLEEYKTNVDKYVLDFIGIVHQYDGYAAEEHNVTTSDGYILTLHRITNSPSSPKKDVKPVVYLQHGIVSSSDTWILGGPKNSLAFQLADAGYDVWLGNSRGNFYSRSHITYSADKNVSKFWDFGIDEMGTKDLTASIDYVLNKTNHQNLTYVGYSLGTTSSYMLLSSKPEYNKKINLLVSIAPIAYFTDPPYTILKTLILTFVNVAKLANLYEILPLSTEMGKFGRQYCNNSKTNICKDVLELISDVDHVDDSRLEQLLLHTPAGTSYRTMDHVRQIFNSGVKLRKYDYGCNIFWCNNKEIYQQSEPPEYDLSLITVPNLIVWAKDDAFIKIKDIKYLRKKLKNVAAMINISNKKFNHLDYIMLSKVKNVAYDKIVKFILSRKTRNRK